MLSPERLERMRDAKLRSVVRNAFDHVPYYRALFLSAGIRPDDIRTAEDLPKLPVTTKRDLRAAGPEKITARWADLSACRTWTTNGTTGEPFVNYWGRTEERTYFMLFMASLLSIGLRPTDRLCVLGPAWTTDRRMYHRFGLFRREVISVSLPFEAQIARLKSFRPTVLWFFPSALRALMHNLGGPLRELIRPRLAISTGEVLDHALRGRVTSDLGVECFDLYGSGEFGPLAWECRAHEGLHFYADHFILECLDIPGAWDMKQAGCAVVTSLYHYVMPFLRYKLEDLCECGFRSCSCGSGLPLIGYVGGRVNELIRLPSGRLLSPLIFQQILRPVRNVEQWRVVQESPGDFVVELAMKDRVDKSILDEVRKDILSYLGEAVNIEMHVVDFMHAETLKFRTFISKIQPTGE